MSCTLVDVMIGDEGVVEVFEKEGIDVSLELLMAYFEFCCLILLFESEKFRWPWLWNIWLWRNDSLGLWRYSLMDRLFCWTWTLFNLLNCKKHDVFDGSRNFVLTIPLWLSLMKLDYIYDVLGELRFDSWSFVCSILWCWNFCSIVWMGYCVC